MRFSLATFSTRAHAVCVPATIALAGLLALVAARAEDAAGVKNTAASEMRLAETLRYLSSDELAGRAPGSPGINAAAEYIARELAADGLETHAASGGTFQKFTTVIGTELGAGAAAALVGPDGKSTTLKLGEDFSPLAIGGSGKFDLPLVFVGYGITAKDDHYDDYAGIDVKDKAVIVWRHEPQQANPHSAFNGTKPSLHAPFSRKLSNAYEHGAAAVVFVTDTYEIHERVEQRRKRWQQTTDELAALQAKFAKLTDPTPAQAEEHRKQVDDLTAQLRSQQESIAKEQDPVIGFSNAGGGVEPGHIPVIHVRRGVIGPVLQAALGSDMDALEREIDKDLKPRSRALDGWRLSGQANVIRTEAEVKNVVAVLPGTGPRAQETIVVGAHYDHLGLGGEGSLAPGIKEIHNGADDNGSGTAALLEVAHLLTEGGRKLPRTVLFIAFTAEERGLIGSAYYCKHPLVKLENTVAMLNMDMVGRLEDDKLIIQGVDTAPEFGPVIDKLNGQYGFKLTKQPGGFGPSDHSSFYAHKIPVMHFFTGVHKDYHRPSDDFDKINVSGMRRVSAMVAETVVALAEMEGRPTYKEAKPQTAAGGGGDRPYFGSIPDFSQSEPGYALSGVAKDSPAARGGLQAGDIIIRLGESRIGNLEDFDSALRKHKSGDKVPVVVKRAGKEVPLTVTLDPPR